jgi:solute carrier family 25 uncoupling protein 8/9
LINLGAYGPIKNILKRLVTDDSQATIKFFRNVTAGCLSGTIAAVASNPVDLCKTKLQAKNSPYTSSIHVIKDVIKHHGVKGLWVGTVPAAIRTGRKEVLTDSKCLNCFFVFLAALTATQCVTYDHAKRFWMRVTGWNDGIKLHLGASLITGLVEKENFLFMNFFMMIRLVTTTVTAPLDMIKTNMYASGDYGVMELTNKVVHKEGLQGLLRGWSAAYVRLGKFITELFV